MACDAKELAADRLFMARLNYSEQLNKLAKDEYERRHKEVVSWVKARIASNIQNLVPFFAQPEVYMPVIDAPFGYRNSCFDRENGSYRFMERKSLERRHGGYSTEIVSDFFNVGNIWFHSGIKGADYTCYSNGAKAQHLISFTPKTPRDVALLCGCELADLPDVLQHWDCRNTNSNEARNHLLSRVDPLDWALSDPWAKLSLTVLIMVSRSTMKRLIGAHNLDLVEG